MGPTGEEGRALSVRVNARLLELSRLGRHAGGAAPRNTADRDTSTESGTSHSGDAAGEHAPEDDVDIRAARVEALRQSHASARNLGFLGSSAGNLPDLPRNVDDFLLWTTVPFLAPFPSWMYHEQLGDLIRCVQGGLCG